MKDLAQFFKALSDETRLKIIILLLLKEELCVCDIENVLKLTQSKASRHLRYLLNSDILSDNRKNIWVYYTINKNLNINKLEFIKIIKQSIDKEKWQELKIKLDKWIESKEKNNMCNISPKIKSVYK